jgi:hypothetical protein
MTSTLSGHLPRQLSRLTRGLPADPVRPDLPRRPPSPWGEGAAPARRVRHEVRDGAAVVAFSAVASTGVALVLLLLAHVAG